MNWKATPPAIETAAATSAAACLGAAVGFAVARTAPLGAGLVVAMIVGALVALAAWLVLGRIDRRLAPMARVESLANLLILEDVLLLDECVDGDEVLLLDDPLPVIDEESRVVRLFAAQPAGPAPSRPLAGPGEMIARIEDFLGQSRAGAAVGEQARPDRAADDANAALHAALADIRRSLRQG